MAALNVAGRSTLCIAAPTLLFPPPHHPQRCQTSNPVRALPLPWGSYATNPPNLAKRPGAFCPAAVALSHGHTDAGCAAPQPALPLSAIAGIATRPDPLEISLLVPDSANTLRYFAELHDRPLSSKTSDAPAARRCTVLSRTSTSKWPADGCHWRQRFPTSRTARCLPSHHSSAGISSSAQSFKAERNCSMPPEHESMSSGNRYRGQPGLLPGPCLHDHRHMTSGRRCCVRRAAVRLRGGPCQSAGRGTEP